MLYREVDTPCTIPNQEVKHFIADNKKVFDKDIAQALNINYDVFRKAKQYNRVSYWEIMQFLAKRNISINWFFFNQLPESLIENTSNYIILKYYNNVTGSAGPGTINYHLDQQVTN